MNPFAELFIRQERRLTRFVAGPGDGERKCRTCIRKQYGGPSCCNEGWDRMRTSDPGGCVNWTGGKTDSGGRVP